MNLIRKILMLCVLGGLAWQTQAASDDEKRAALESQMANAQAQLEAAAERIAELSRKMTEGEVMTVVSRMHNKKRKALLGVRIDDSDSSSGKGILIESVSPAGPAASVGIEAGDVVTAIDGQSVQSDNGVGVLLEVLTGLKPGDVVNLAIDRDGRALSKDVETTSYADAFPEQHARNVQPFAFDDGQIEQWIENFKDSEFMRDADIDIKLSAEDLEKLRHLPQRLEESLSGINVGPVITMLGARKLGLPHIEMTEISPELGAYFGVDKGVLITKTPGMMASASDASGAGENSTQGTDLGLRAGDVLLSIDGQSVSTKREVQKLLMKAEPESTLSVVLVRQRETVNVDVRVPDPFSDGNWRCEESDDGKHRKCVNGDDNMFSFSFSTDDDEE